ncbi:hypothetical protein TNCV_2601051 [Trichonephila clavipes]|nr:hypothetical protein TNCV_2601051 [Trichonephila clavipes]
MKGSSSMVNLFGGSCSSSPSTTSQVIISSSSVVISVGVAFRDLCGTLFISISGFCIFGRFLLFLDFRFTICWASAAVECSLLDSLGTDSGKFSVETELSLAGVVRERVSVSKGETKVFRLLPGEVVVVVVGMGICNQDSLCIVGSIPDGEGSRLS